MTSFKELLVILSLMLVSGLAGFAFYKYIIVPSSEVNIIETRRSPEAPKTETVDQQTVKPDGIIDLSKLIAQDLNAKPVSFDKWAGKTLVINFWATWCPPCRKEIPLFIEAQESYASQDVQILGVAMDDPKAVEKYMQSVDFNYPILISDLNETIRIGQAFSYDFIALPFTLLVSADGKLSHAHTGELDAKEINALIQQFLDASKNTI